jgi:uncharacterized HAD superfamily protein
MAFKIAVVDLDGCIIDDINAKFESRLGSHKGQFNNMFRETIFELLNVLPHSNKFYNSLLRESDIDKEIIAVMEKAQEHGTVIHIVTKHKGLDVEWLSKMLSNYNIKVPPQNIHIVNGNKASVVNSLNADLFLDDQFESVSKLNENIKIRLLKRTYNTIGSNTIRLLRKGQDVKVEDARSLLAEV